MATNKLIDLSRLSRFWDKVKAYVDNALANKVSKSGDTMTGPLDIRGSAGSKPLRTRGIVGSDGSGGDGDLYLQLGNNTTDDIYFGNAGAGRITNHGMSYNGTAAVAASVAWSNVSGKPSRYPTAYLDVEGDHRNVATTPNDYGNKLFFRGLKTNTVINSPTSDTYSYILGLRGWNDPSGGASWELAFNNTGVFVRKQNGSNNSWNGWTKVDTGLTYVGSTTGSTAKNFTIPSFATEIIITAYMSGINKLFSSSLPWTALAQSTSTSYEFWVGGGKNQEGTGNAGAARAICQIQKSSATNLYLKGVDANNAGTATLTSTTFGVYYR